MSTTRARNASKRYSESEEFKLSKKVRTEDEEPAAVKKHPINPQLAITKESECLSCLGRHRPHTCGRQGRRGRLPGSLGRKPSTNKTCTKIKTTQPYEPSNTRSSSLPKKIKTTMAPPPTSEPVISVPALPLLPSIQVCEDMILPPVEPTTSNGAMASPLFDFLAPAGNMVEDEDSMMSILFEDYMKDFISEPGKKAV